MARFCGFDQRTKKLYILFFGLLLSYAPIFIFENLKYFKEIKAFGTLTRALAKILIFIPYIINKKCINKKIVNNRNIIIIKNNTKDYIILIFFPIIYFLSKVITNIFQETYEFINQSLTLIFLSFFMKFYSTFRFYNYNIISVIMFATLAIILDAFIYKETFTFILILLNILSSVLYSVELNYRKYLMDNKYISLYKIICFCGIIDFIILTILEILTINYKLFFNKQIIEIPIQYRDIKTNYFLIVSGSILILIFYSIHIIIFYLLIYHFTPIHAVVIDTIKISIKSIYKLQFLNVLYKINIITLIIFSILSLFIYLEIIELKCCGLNKNIRKNILKRMDTDKTMYDTEDGIENDSENDRIDLGDGYIVELKRGESELTNWLEDEDRDEKMRNDNKMTN